MSSKNCLKRVFNWSCGCKTEQFNHAPAHRAAHGEECPGKVTVISTQMYKKHNHLKNPNAKLAPGQEPEMIECQGHQKPEEAGAAWGEIPDEEEVAGDSAGQSTGVSDTSADGEWSDVGAGGHVDHMTEDAGW